MLSRNLVIGGSGPTNYISRGVNSWLGGPRGGESKQVSFQPCGSIRPLSRPAQAELGRAPSWVWKQ